MTTHDRIREGDSKTYTRTFTNEEVQQFAELSNDTGYHHLVADEDGQVVLHGLLTATMPTKLGGDLNYLARTMEFEFPRPAYTGVEITCEATYESVEKQDDCTYLEVSFVCETEDGDVVLRGRSEGAIMG
ncbi:(R)-specific enoyl -CoA hydratase [Haloferax elongans ATCC BAA-1513]|uniref:(R)-specific enoyl-CoA hydratase n=1 Tax=Haloferax elongans ATCC BAA-1513 TaxID=1230453 RepID=M0HN60_HALEO|nr:MaoC family dehydratase N-terminal domain-containing protein [Haloferax elongans]ELZ85946.1 (R)-specific enoyl -CoA hydratase [Haloferax elongans ATCC BAA-1513]